MDRRWSDGRCPGCGKMPNSDKRGLLVCASEGRSWERVAGVKGTVEEAEMLKAHGFWFATSANGDEYYVGTLNRLVWLYVDGTWASDPRPSRVGMSLEEYLKETGDLARV